MRFKLKDPKPEPYKPGDKRTRYRFAFLPREIDNHIIWLEKYQQTVVYSFAKIGKDIVLSSWEVLEEKLLDKHK